MIDKGVKISIQMAVKMINTTASRDDLGESVGWINGMYNNHISNLIEAVETDDERKYVRDNIHPDTLISLGRFVERMIGIGAFDDSYHEIFNNAGLDVEPVKQEN